MSAYIARIIGTNELVGLVVADSIKNLFWAVDEVTDPHDCEYKRITGGGVLWHEGGDMYPDVQVEEDSGYLPLDGASLSDWTVMEYEDKRPWKRFKAGDGLTKTGCREV